MSHDNSGSSSASQNKALPGDALFEAAFAYAAVPIAIATPSGQYLRVNSAYEELVGYSEEDLRSLDFYEITHPDDREAKGQLVSQLVNGEIPAFVIEKRYLRKTGEPVWVLNSVSLVRDDDAQPSMLITLSEDITARKLADQERGLLLDRERTARTRAERAERTLQATIERMPAGIILVDANGQVVSVNEAGRQIGGRIPEPERPVAEQAADYEIRDAASSDPIPPHMTPIARAVAGETVTGYQSTFTRPTDGSEVVVRVDAVPLRDEDGTITGAIATFLDVTNERVAQRQQRDLLFAAAHDLKNPLTSIKGFTQMLQRRLSREGVLAGENTERDLDRIVSTTTKMNNLISELLDTARLEMGEALELRREPVDLVDVAQKAIEYIHESMYERPITLQTDEVSVVGAWDLSRLERVVSNLVANAVKYSHDESPIVLTVSRDGPCAILKVEDHGIGIPASEQPRIFNRFFRGSNVPDTASGSGIGLAGARQIVEQHGGSINVHSVEGEGTTLTVRLPLSS